MKLLKIILIIISLLLVFLFFVRLTTPREIDDIHFLRGCEKEYIEKADILWVIPEYKNVSISENQTWCKEILNLNKTLGLHGITHSYYEFENNISQQEFSKAIQIFEDCFEYKPTIFKPPYLKISKQNKKLIKENNLTLRTNFHQTIHKVYHCQNAGRFSNKFHDLF